MDTYFFWVKVFAPSFAIGVVSGITMSFQFGTNWSGFMERVGSIAGPLLAYEVLTAFWILVLNSWMHTSQGYEIRDAVAYATDWRAMVFNPSMPCRLVRVVLASGLTVAFLVADLSSLRGLFGDHGRAPKCWRGATVWRYGMAAISLATPLASERIWERWLGFPETLYLAPLPVLTLALFVWLWRLSGRMPLEGDRMNLAPFISLAGIFCLGFAGLAWSFYPYVVPGRITIVEAASATESLAIILVGTLFVLPVITGYSIWAYRIFGGKAVDLRYD